MAASPMGKKAMSLHRPAVGHLNLFGCDDKKKLSLPI